MSERTGTDCRQASCRGLLFCILALSLIHCGGCAKEAKKPESAPAAAPEQAEEPAKKEAPAEADRDDAPAGAAPLGLDEEGAAEEAPSQEKRTPAPSRGRGAPRPKAAEPQFAPPPESAEGSADRAFEPPRVLGPKGQSWLLPEAKRRSVRWLSQQRRALELKKPDCPSAKEHRDNICRLAERICELRPQGPNTVSIADYCTDAKERCGDAKQRYAQVCE